MKKSSIMHWIARLVGVLGGLALVGAWVAGEGGTALGFSQRHLYNDAIVLTLISIAALMCALVYLQQEKSQ
jgi:hypothetical protein